jgi:hypothetical protein
VLYGSDPELTNRLDLDPRTAERNSVALAYRQPRAFYPEEEITVTYEGVFVSERRIGLLRLGGPEEPNRLEDADARFCDRGVQDASLTREVGIELGVEQEQLDAFVRRHADYVQLIAELPEESDSYWSTRRSVGYTCGDQGDGNGYFACEAIFGTPEEPTPARELRVVEAYQNRLVIEPREPERSDILDLLYCCFGAGEVLSYVVRAGHQWVVRSSASGFQHNVVAGPESRCVRDCAPRRAWHRGRAFEVATRSQVCDDENGECSHQACVFPASEALDDEEAGEGLPGPVPHDSPCVFQNLTLRFAVYRGRHQSERDMAFAWDLTGGFVPLTVSLLSAGGTTAVLPQSLVYVPQIVSLAVTDGAQKGLTFVSLDTLAPSVMYY